MANPKLLSLLLEGSKIWNNWRNLNPNMPIDLVQANLVNANLEGANLKNANLKLADLREANLRGANLQGALIPRATLEGANLSRANLRGASLNSTNLSGANFTDAILIGADLSRSTMIYTILQGADISGCRIFGISAWNINTTNLIQSNLVINPGNEREITVDNVEVAQLVYLLLHNEKLRDVISTVATKAVLILGRFHDAVRKDVLDGIRTTLRDKGYLPIVFDFEKARERDFTETIKVLAGLSLFVIADITSPKSTPLELQAIVPDYMIPFVPIIQEEEQPFAMFQDLVNKYKWMLELTTFHNKEALVAQLDNEIINRALNKRDELIQLKNRSLKIRRIEDSLPN